MLVPCSTPEKGYASLFPHVEFGDDLAMALYRVGIRAFDSPVAVSGYGLIFPTTGKTILLQSYSESGARIEAIKMAISKPVILTRAIARGRVTVHERIERIEVMSQSVMAKIQDAMLIAPNGVLVEKAQDVFDKKDIRRISGQLAGRLQSVDKKFIKPHLDKLLDQLVDQPWGTLSRTERAKIFKKAEQRMAALASETILPKWEKELKVTTEIVGEKTKKQITERHFPRMSVSFDRDETKALEQIGSQQGWFLRDNQGQMSTRITNKGRKVVEEGLAMGLGRTEIGKRLKDNVSGLWDKYGANYANVVAANAVVRARSFAEMSTYQDAGIELLEIVAMLDERTSDVCRYMDGQVIAVNECMNLATEAANVSDPKDIYKASPFMSVKNTPEGKILTTGNGAQIAEMTRSGKGIVNDRGGFSGYKMGNQLPGAKIGAPPYHHSCRTTTLPRVESFQVPSKYEVRTANAPISQASSLKALPQRQMEMFSAPSEEEPALQGTALPIDTYVLPSKFDIGPTDTKRKNHLDKKGANWAFRSFKTDSDNRTFTGSEHYKHISTSKKKPVSAQYTELMDPKLFGSLDGEGGIVQTMTNGDFSDNNMSSLISNKGAEGQDSLVKLYDKKNKEKLVRLNMKALSDADKNFLDFSRNKLTAGDMSKKDHQALIKRGKKNGWLKIGDELDTITTTASSRVSTGTKKPKTKVKKPTKTIDKKKPVQPKPKPAKVPAPPPSKKLSAGKKTPKGLPSLEINTRDLSQLPDNDDLRVAIVNSEARQRILNVKNGKIEKGGEWTKQSGTQYMAGRRYKVTLEGGDYEKGGDTITQIFQPELVVDNRGDERYASGNQIAANVMSDLKNAKAKGVRDFMMSNTQGETLFMRINCDHLGELDDKVIRKLPFGDGAAEHGIFDSKVDDSFAKAGFKMSTDIRDMYKDVEIDWSQSNLILGIPPKEQAYKRADTITAQINERANKAAEGGTPPTQALARSIQAEIGSINTGGVKPTSVLQIHPKNDNPSDKGIIDFAVGDVSKGMQYSLSTEKAPEIIKIKKKRASYVNLHLEGKERSLVRINPDSKLSVVKHEFQHHVDTFGQNKIAARHLMARNMEDGTIEVMNWGTGDEAMFPTRAKSNYSAKGYGQTSSRMLTESRKKNWKTSEQWGEFLDKTTEGMMLGKVRAEGTEFFTQAATEIEEVAAGASIRNGSTIRDFAPGNIPIETKELDRFVDADRLANGFRRCPDQLSGYLATRKGMFQIFANE